VSSPNFRLSHVKFARSQRDALACKLLRRSRAEDVVVAAHVQDADTVGAVAVVTRAEVAAGADHANDRDCCVTVAATLACCIAP
jgi:hypothetical protein